MSVVPHTHKQHPKYTLFLLFFAGVFAITGIILLVRSSALTPTAQLQPEQGTVSLPATSIADATASGGSAVKFNTAASSPSGEAMPVGNLPGFTQILAQDFNTTATPATFTSTYANSWCPYDDGGQYYRSQVSGHDGIMDIMLDGTKGAAGVFGPPGKCWSNSYGRFSMRLRVVGATGNGTAIMLWPSSDKWTEGEIDYPETFDFSGTLHAFHHPTPCNDNINSTPPPPYCGTSDGYDTQARWTDWHTVATEWTPASVKYYLDNTLVKTVTHDIPTTNHRYTLQVAPTGSNPQPGNMQIDWVTMYSYSP